MKLNITFDISIEEAIAIADWHRARSKEDEKEWQEKHPIKPMTTTTWPPSDTKPMDKSFNKKS